MVRAALIASAMALASVSTALAGPCRDIPTTWTIASVFVDGTTATRIYGDGASYVDGSQGVMAAIKVCSGTNDAVLSMSTGRSVLFNLAGTSLDASPLPPAWASAGPFASPAVGNRKGCSGSPCTVVNIRNILDSGTAPRDQYYIIHTRLDTGFVAPDSQTYHLPMHNPATADVARDANDSFINFPDVNARVVVEHFPATAQTKEQWHVYAEQPGVDSPSPENATLVSGDRSVSYGQVSVPFNLTITVK